MFVASSRFKIIGVTTSIIFVLLIFILFYTYEIDQISPKYTKFPVISEVIFLKKTGVFGSEVEQFDYPVGLEFFNNQLFVLDSGNNRVQIFSEDLDFKSVINLPDNQNLPKGIAVTSNKIFVAYTYDYQVRSFDYDGNLLSQFPVSWTTDLEADEDFIYVLEPLANNIQVYDHLGVLVKQLEAHKNVHYINSNQKNLIASGAHPSVNIPPEILIYDKNSGMLQQRFPVSGNVIGSAITENNVLFLELDTVKVVDFDGNIRYEYSLESGIDNILHSQIEMNGNIVYVNDLQGHSIKSLKIIYEWVIIVNRVFAIEEST